MLPGSIPDLHFDTTSTPTDRFLLLATADRFVDAHRVSALGSISIGVLFPISRSDVLKNIKALARGTYHTLIVVHRWRGRRFQPQALERRAQRRRSLRHRSFHHHIPVHEWRAIAAAAVTERRATGAAGDVGV